jgi:hypothetical protein
MADEHRPFERYRREIPPRINPDTEDILKQITAGYEDAKGHLTYLESEFERLVRFELIEPMAGHRLARDCRGMQKTLHANTLGAIHASDGNDPHFIADRAKYTHAILNYQLAQMQYQIGELATLGRFERTEHHDLQWGFFNADTICYALWAGIVEATVDWSIDGGDFHTGFYSDGRMITTKINLGLSRELIDVIWPNDHDDLCGDGPITDWYRGIIAHIEPPEPSKKPWSGCSIKIDISRVLEG